MVLESHIGHVILIWEPISYPTDCTHWNWHMVIPPQIAPIPADELPAGNVSELSKKTGKEMCYYWQGERCNIILISLLHSISEGSIYRLTNSC